MGFLRYAVRYFSINVQINQASPLFLSEFLHDECQQYIPIFPEVQPLPLRREYVRGQGGVVCGFYSEQGARGCDAGGCATDEMKREM
jgi:hypothetical protein